VLVGRGATPGESGTVTVTLHSLQRPVFPAIAASATIRCPFGQEKIIGCGRWSPLGPIVPGDPDALVVGTSFISFGPSLGTKSKPRSGCVSWSGHTLTTDDCSSTLRSVSGGRKSDPDLSVCSG
jgi:hypothetical protein